MLQTDEIWEYSYDGKMLGSFLRQPGQRQYACVEISLNVALFHVDIVFRDKHQIGQSWSRFIVDDIENVLQLIRRDDVIKVHISLQTSRSANAEYKISSVVEIIQGISNEGRKHYMCKCSNDAHYVDATIGDVKIELSEQRTVWSSTASQL
ncbi:hypothetical protein [Collimonas sp.]|jgi:hypothetical protein|uniref:hypothetical protein n=1 Tax=Collimonas sp. TaxID=1963772 RepID=UPI002C8468DB|nr:hypothetical protein [Collimonas sp.]HWW05647.1 hypothetical protein [Collimonas sp.]